MIIPMQAGIESKERIELLLTLTPKFNDNTKKALRFHFVNGGDVAMCSFMFGIAQPNMQRSINRLNEVNHTVEQIKQLDLYHLSE